MTPRAVAIIVCAGVLGWVVLCLCAAVWAAWPG